MAGTPKWISIDGTRYALPNDVAPIVTEGGRYTTETEAYSDGRAKPIESVVIGKITGIVVDTTDDLYDALKNAAGKKGIPIGYQSQSKYYECTGVIVVSDGLQNDTRNDKTAEFEIHSTNGPIRAS